MLANTGTVSFVLYGVFIAITIVAMCIAFYFIKKGTIPPASLDKMIELFKYTIVSVAIATVTLIISDLFKEREQDVKELEYFDKYVEDVKKVDNIQQRLQLAKYLSIVAPSGELKRSWSSYYDSVRIEYSDYLRLKLVEQALAIVKDTTYQQQVDRLTVQQAIMQKEAPLVSTQPVTTKDATAAMAFEKAGLEALVKKDVSGAIEAFTQCENAYNQYHSAYEIARYLKDNKAELSDPGSPYWNIAYTEIGKKYPALTKMLREPSRGTEAR